MDYNEEEYGVNDNYDANNYNDVDIFDYAASDRIVKIYPYRAIYGNENKKWMEEGATTIVSISQTPFAKEVSVETDMYPEEGAVHFDENNNVFVNMVGAWNEYVGEIKTFVNTGKSVSKRRILNFSGLVQWKIEREEYQPDFFTIGEPADISKINNREQPIYMLEKVVESDQLYGDYGEAEDIVELADCSEFTFTDVMALETNFTMSRIYFTLEAPIKGDRIKIGMQNHAILGGISAKGSLSKIWSVALNYSDYIWEDFKLFVKMDQIPKPEDFYSINIIVKYVISLSNYNPFVGGEKVFNIEIQPEYLRESTTKPGYYEIDRTNEISYWENDIEHNHNSVRDDMLGTPTWEMTIEGMTGIRTNEDIEYGDVEFISNETFVPFKMTPIEMDRRLVMHSDWFDYDFAMPVFMADEVINKTTVDVNTAETVSTASLVDLLKYKLNGAPVEDTEAIQIVEDLILISYLFTNNFKGLNRKEGRIDEIYKLGHAELPITDIINKTVVEVCDSIIENAVRKNPWFTNNDERYQKLRSVVAALSRYVNSSLSIGRGSNAFNYVYLPWFLELQKGLDIKLTEYKSGTGTDAVVVKITVNLKEAPTFLLRTAYFKEEFTDGVIEKTKYLTKTSGIELPKRIDLSKTLYFQTDRKVNLPKIPDQLKEMNKVSMPGDLDLTNSDQLAYLWYLPITNKDKFNILFLNQQEGYVESQPGDKVRVLLQPTKLGELISRDEALRKIVIQQPGIIDDPSQLNILKTSRKLDPQVVLRFYTKTDRVGVGGQTGGYQDFVHWIGTDIGFNNRWTTFMRGDEVDPVRPNVLYSDASADGREQIQNVVNFVEKTWSMTPGSLKLDQIKYYISGKNDYGHYDDFIFNTEMFYQTFTPVEVTITDTAIIQNNYINKRVNFDKNEWEKFISKAGIVPRGILEHIFSVKDDYRITELNELYIQTVFSDKLQIFYGDNKDSILEIETQDKYDESIATKKLIFF